MPDGQCDDVALDVFLRYDKYQHTIASPFAIPAWLKTTTVHISHEYKNQKIARHETPTDPDELEPEGVEPGPEEKMLGDERYGSLLELVDALEPGRRKVFTDYVFEQIPIAEIAEELQIPEATAYNRLRLAREDLMVALERFRKVEAHRRAARGYGFFPPFLLGLADQAWQSIFRDLPGSLYRSVRHLRGIVFRSLRTLAFSGAGVVVSGAILRPAPDLPVVPAQKVPASTALVPSTSGAPIARVPPAPVAPPRPPAPTSPVPGPPVPRLPVIALPQRKASNNPVPAQPAPAVAPGNPAPAEEALSRKQNPFTFNKMFARGISVTAGAATERGAVKEARARYRAYRLQYPDDPFDPPAPQDPQTHRPAHKP